jgi:hypothetical protein
LHLLDAGPQKDDSEAKHPNLSDAIATLPDKRIDGSLSEIEYVLDAPKMDGVSTLIGEL